MRYWEGLTEDGLVMVEPDPRKVDGLKVTLSDADDEEWSVVLAPDQARSLLDALQGWLAG